MPSLFQIIFGSPLAKLVLAPLSFTDLESVARNPDDDPCLVRYDQQLDLASTSASISLSPDQVTPITPGQDRLDGLRPICPPPGAS